MTAGIAALMFVIAALAANADSLELQQLRIAEKKVLVARIHLEEKEPKLELYWKKEDGTPFQTFESLRSWLNSKNKKLLFAANAGIYRASPSFAPIGLHVENGTRMARLSMAKNCGNFCWYSGVFAIENNRGFILPREDVSSVDFSKTRIAVQSGPLFMRSGKLQGTWSRSSYNLNRSAVCTTDQSSEAILILVMDSTNFYEFFDVVKTIDCRDALFLDGSVSSFYDGSAGVRFGNQFESYAGIFAVTN